LGVSGFGTLFPQCLLYQIWTYIVDWKLLEVAQHEEVCCCRNIGSDSCYHVRGIMTASVLGDENYEDNGQEFSEGDGEAPDDGMAREEPRLRFKDV
jgi:hypothetical protein